MVLLSALCIKVRNTNFGKFVTVMSKFFARVQMKNSYVVDYGLVHQVLATSHFYQSEDNGDGTETPTPWGTYVCEGNFTTQQAMDMIKHAISSMGCAAEIVVTRADGMLHDTVE